jgi:hypothetical protein
VKLRAIRDNILCINGDFGDMTTESGLIIKSTAGKSEGITPRWFQIFELGPEADKQLTVGQWVYVAMVDGLKHLNVRMSVFQMVKQKFGK